MYTRSEYVKERNRQEEYIHDHFHMEYSCKSFGRCVRDGWECFAYSVTLTGTIHPNPASFTINLYSGMGNVFKETDEPYGPLPFSVLNHIYLEDTKGASFEDWCVDLGYDTDSRKALAAYLQCQEQTSRFKKAFPDVNLEDDEEIMEY